MDSTLDSRPDPAARRPPTAEGASPAMAQWFAAKAENPDALLFFRMGDFFEMFFADAEAAATALDIALTYRGEHQGQRIAMCGVPAHSHESYLARLIRRGFRVAICEQMENPGGGEAAQGPGGAPPGGAAGHARHGHRGGAAGSRPAGLAAGAGAARRPARRRLARPLDRRLRDRGAAAGRPAGAAGPAGAGRGAGPGRPRPARRRWRWRCRATPPAGWPKPMGWRRWTASANTTRPRSPPPPWRWTTCAPPRRGPVAAASGLPHLSRPVPCGGQGVLQMDAATRRSLEILRPERGGPRDCLLGAVRPHRDRGRRRAHLAAWLGCPLAEAAPILARQDAVAALLAAEPLRAALRASLRGAPDMARALARLSLDRFAPRDLAAIREGLLRAAAIAGALARPDGAGRDPAAAAPGRHRAAAGAQPGRRTGPGAGGRACRRGWTTPASSPPAMTGSWMRCGGCATTPAAPSPRCSSTSARPGGWRR